MLRVLQRSCSHLKVLLFVLLVLFLKLALIGYLSEDILIISDVTHSTLPKIKVKKCVETIPLYNNSECNANGKACDIFDYF